MKEQKAARRDSRKDLKFISDKKIEISLNRTFTKDEFEKISLGLIPFGMDDKWFIFLENDTLFFHRSWTGQGIYEVRFIQKDDFYVAAEAWVNRDSSQYKQTDMNFDEKLLMFLIENLLLGNKTPFPVPSDILNNSPKGAFQHNIAGTGFTETEVEKD